MTAPFKIEPRLLTREAAAQYCSLSPEQFSLWVKVGRLPRPVHGTHRWDKRAIDHKLDLASLLPVQSARQELSPLEQYRAERDARRAARSG